MMLEAAPTPCRRTGFHMMTISLCAAAVLLTTPAAVQAAGPAAVLHVGSMIIKSPGAAASMAAWMESEAATWVGLLPPIVTVTASIDCRPLPAVITSSPQRAVDPPYCACCCTAQFGTEIPNPPSATLIWICVGDHEVMFIERPPIVTAEIAVQPPPIEVHRLPKP